MALYSLYCAEVPLRNCSLTHSRSRSSSSSTRSSDIFYCSGSRQLNHSSYSLLYVIRSNWAVDTGSLSCKNLQQFPRVHFYGLDLTCLSVTVDELASWTNIENCNYSKNCEACITFSSGSSWLLLVFYITLLCRMKMRFQMMKLLTRCLPELKTNTRNFR